MEMEAREPMDAVSPFFSPAFLPSSSPADDAPIHGTQDAEGPRLQILPSLSSSGLPPVILINKPFLRIGRVKDKVDILLDSKIKPRMISRLHAIIQFDEERNTTKLIDCKSLNGLFVNNIKTTEAELRDGDVIVFGEGGTISPGMPLPTANPEIVYTFRSGRRGRKRKHRDCEAAPKQKERLEKRRRDEEESERRVREEIQQLKEALAEKQRMLETHLRRMQELEDTLRKTSQETEEEKRRQQAMFHEQLTHLREELDSEKTRIHVIEEQQRQAYENEKKQLEEELAKHKHTLAALQQETIQTKDLEEEFTCTICQSLMIQAATLPCSHSFCCHCITDWLILKKQCPICRKDAATFVRARNLDNIIEKIVDKLVPEEKAEWKAQRDRISHEMEEVRKLKSMIDAAKNQGLRFLSITDEWSEAESKVFLDGVSRYRGKCRVMYCSTTGLTKDFIDQCSIVQLRIAVANVKCQFGPDEDPRDAGLCRQKLHAFIALAE